MASVATVVVMNGLKLDVLGGPPTVGGISFYYTDDNITWKALAAGVTIPKTTQKVKIAYTVTHGGGSGNQSVTVVAEVGIDIASANPKQVAKTTTVAPGATVSEEIIVNYAAHWAVTGNQSGWAKLKEASATLSEVIGIWLSF